MRFGVVVFPGTYSDRDCFFVLKDVLNREVDFIWHKDQDLSRFDCVILPGGFSYGDYLRPGAIARFSPIMEAIKNFAITGGLVIGICNGFQILCEADLLPGVLLRNEHLEFRCEWSYLKVENSATTFTNSYAPGEILRIPISHGDGRYYADESTLHDLEHENRIVLRYCDPEGNVSSKWNPNGSLGNIAGIINREGNVLGMMPHPERACEEILGGVDGIRLLSDLVSIKS